jgi:hypothetical protein
LQRKNGYIGIEVARKRHLGFFNRANHPGKLGGVKSVSIMRNKNSFIFKAVHFDSRGEMEIAMCLYYQFKINLIEKKTIHVVIGGKEFDFFVNNSFIEYHPFNSFWESNKINPQIYYKSRRTILNNCGYTTIPLIILK